MAKKDFKGNPAMSFISQESIEKVDKAPEARSSFTGTPKPPKGYKLNPEFIETKSRRVQILMQPSIYEAIKAKADTDGVSTNEAICEAIRAYLKG